MEVVFLGVGEAFDENLPNTSLLVRQDTDEPGATLLLDCGFTVPPRFWAESPDPDELDGIWISHFHGDHFFGIPALLVRFWEEKRSKPLTFLGQKGVESRVRDCLDLAYPGFNGKLTFEARFMEVEPGNDIVFEGFTLRTAENGHSMRDLALRIDAGGKSLYYSGDGRPTAEGASLARGADLVIQEAFHPETEFPGHGTALGAIDMAGKCGAARLALVHVNRDARDVLVRDLDKLASPFSGIHVRVPEPGHRLVL